MGYQENYIIDPEIQEDEPIVEKEMESVSITNNQIQRDYEIIEDPMEQKKSVFEEIHEEAVKEGLVDEDEEPIGGENPTPQEVIDGLKNKARSKGALKNQEEYEEKKVKATKKVMATREILTGMTKRHITTSVDVVLDMEQEDGSIKPELVSLQLKVKRLTESQVNHLFNRRMAGKTVDEMTPEELQEDNHFRSKFLAETVVEPQMDADVWYEEVPAIALGTIYHKVNEVLGSIDNTELFQ